MMKNLPEGIQPLNTKTVYRVGFWAYGGKPMKIKHVFATNNDPYAAVTEVNADSRKTDSPVYDLCGRVVASDLSDLGSLSRGVYVVEGRKIAKY